MASSGGQGTDRPSVRQPARYESETALSDILVGGVCIRKVSMITRLLKNRVITDKTVARIGQVTCFGCACVIPVLAFWKFARINMSEAELLIGVLVTMSMALQFALIGLHLETEAKAA